MAENCADEYFLCVGYMYIYIVKMFASLVAHIYIKYVEATSS